MTFLDEVEGFLTDDFLEELEDFATAEVFFVEVDF